MFGYCSMGILSSDRAPAIMIMIASTQENIGRLMKKLDIR